MSNKPRKMTLEKKHNLTGWAFLAPATFLIAVFSFWPMIKALVLSFQTGKGRNMQWLDLQITSECFKMMYFFSQ